MQDIQAGKISSQFSIRSAGVTNLRYPFLIRETISGEVQRVTAEWKMGVAIPRDQRGTHMSRFIEELESRSETPLEFDAVSDFARSVSQRLDAPEADLKITFPWFHRVAAPVSKQTSLMHYDLTFEARHTTSPVKTLEVVVPCKALCPCSKSISDRGAHNQRSYVRARLDFAHDAKAPSFLRIADLMQDAASSRVYPLLKREDEKYVTEHAYDNPTFVEDLVRGVGMRLADTPNLRGLTISALNQESIHNHDCFAELVLEL